MTKGIKKAESTPRNNKDGIEAKKAKIETLAELAERIRPNILKALALPNNDEKRQAFNEEFQRANIDGEMRNKIAREILKTIDLSEDEGKIIAARLCDAMLINFESGKVPPALGTTIRNSLTQKIEILEINEGNLLKNYSEIENYYGHFEIKRISNFINFLMGFGYWISKHLDDLYKTGADADEFHLAFVLYNANCSSAVFSGSMPDVFLSNLAKQIRENKISSEEKAKKHPNYPLIEELAIKTNRQTKTISEIIFKTLSSVVHIKNFKAPTMNWGLKKKRSLLKTNKVLEANEILISKTCIFSDKPPKGGVGENERNMWNEKLEKCVNTFSFDADLEEQTKKWIEIIDFLQPLLDEYNAKMAYYGPEGKMDNEKR